MQTEGDKRKCIIVDDAPQARMLLRIMLQELSSDIKVIGEAGNVEDALALIHREHPDFVFLDIEMPGKSGLELLEELHSRQFGGEVIFTTACDEYAIRAFKLSAVDYLLKPIQAEELQEAIQKAIATQNLKQSAARYHTLMNNLQENAPGVVALPLNYGYEYVEVQDIEFVEAERSYSYIHFRSGSQKLVAKNLGYFEDVLRHLPVFVKTHRSFLVNIRQVKGFQKKGEGGILTFPSNKQVEVSRSCRKELLERLAVHSGNLNP